MKKIYYKLLGLLIHSIMLILLFSCGKPNKEEKKENIAHRRSETRTEIDEEMEVLTNASPKIEKRLLSKTKVLSIRIYPKKVLNPIEETDRVRLSNCGRGDWDVNEIYYDKAKASWKNYTQSLDLVASKDLHFTAYSPSGGSINASLGELLKSSDASISKNPHYIEIKLPSKRWPSALGKEELDIELKLIPSKTVINVGSMKEVRRVCTRTRGDPPRGADGGRGGGGWLNYEKASSEGYGFTSQVFEVQYDLEVYFISHY